MKNLSVFCIFIFFPGLPVREMNSADQRMANDGWIHYSERGFFFSIWLLQPMKELSWSLSFKAVCPNRKIKKPKKWETATFGSAKFALSSSIDGIWQSLSSRAKNRCEKIIFSSFFWILRAPSQKVWLTSRTFVSNYRTQTNTGGVVLTFSQNSIRLKGVSKVLSIELRSPQNF